MNKEILKQIGLQDSEIDVYLALLKLGSVTTTKLTQETGIHRTYIYDILEKLREKGLVSCIIKNNKKHFQAAYPEKLIDYLNERLDNIKEILPELINLTKLQKEEITVEVFKGKEGIKTLLNDIVKEGKNYLGFGAIREFEEILPAYSKQFIRRVNEKGLKERVILQQGVKVLQAKKKEYKYLPKEYMPPTSVVVYGNKTALTIWKPAYLVILISNKEIADSYRIYFNVLWKIAKLKTKDLYTKNGT